MADYWPYILIGLFSGSVYALAAMGLVLTYKTSGVFNFAYGAIAMFCGFTFSQVRDTWGITSWISLPLTLFVVAPLIGIVCERVFRPVVSLSAEIQIVIALGVLAFLQAVVPLVYGTRARALRSIFPETTFSVGSTLNVSYTQLYTLLLAGLLSLGLFVLLRRTRFGIETQAVVDNRDLAELIGVSSDSVSRVAWMISCVFAALVGILLSSSQGLDVYTLVVVVIYAFAPAVLGKLVSLPLAFAGAMALGVAQSVLARYGSSPSITDFRAALPYLSLFLLLLVYGKGLKEVRSSFRSITASAPTGGTQRLMTGAGVMVALGLLFPTFGHGSVLRAMTAGLVFAAVAVTLVVLTGWAGQISLAQFSFVGVGAFAAGNWGHHDGSGFLMAAILGALIAIPLGLIVGVPSLRLSGLFLALATMAFALLLDNLVFSKRWVSGGSTGLVVARPKVLGFSFGSDERFYYLALALLVVYAGAASALRRGPVGRRLQILRDAPQAAATFGVNPVLTKLIVFAACGAAAAFAGAFYGALRQTVTPLDFAFGASLQLLLLVVLGGRALVAGALVAGAVFASQLLPAAAGTTRYIPLGVAAGVLMVAQKPEGPLSLLQGRTQRFSALFRKRQPRVADVAVARKGLADA